MSHFNYSASEGQKADGDGFESSAMISSDLNSQDVTMESSLNDCTSISTQEYITNFIKLQNFGHQNE